MNAILAIPSGWWVVIQFALAFIVGGIMQGGLSRLARPARRPAPQSDQWAHIDAAYVRTVESELFQRQLADHQRLIRDEYEQWCSATQTGETGPA